MNVIAYSTNHTVAVHDIFNCTVHVEVRNTNNYKFIRNFMKGMIYELDTRKYLFDLINFNGSKLVQVADEILEVYHSNTTFMLYTLHDARAGFS